jgi:hypothetical protein
MNDLATTIILILVAAFGPGIAIVVLVFLNVEKVQKWGAILGYCLGRISEFFGFLNKKAVQLDLQGNINSFVKQVAKEVPSLELQKVKVEYVDTDSEIKSILGEGEVILRLRRDDPRDFNFVHGAFMFVSTSLLYKVKRYISISQRVALDLYVTTQIIESEKPKIVGCFLDEFLHPNLKDPKSDRSKYFDQLSKIDNGGLFYPVLLEELHFLGNKVFGNRKDEKIILEVHALINFLENFSQRKLGAEIDLDFIRDYCKSAILIIGKKSKLFREQLTPYVNRIRQNFAPEKIETVFILGHWENKNLIDEVAESVSDLYCIIRGKKSRMLLNREDGSQIPISAYIMVLQLIGAKIYHPA